MKRECLLRYCFSFALKNDLGQEYLSVLFWGTKICQALSRKLAPKSTTEEHVTCSEVPTTCRVTKQAHGSTVDVRVQWRTMPGPGLGSEGEEVLHRRHRLLLWGVWSDQSVTSCWSGFSARLCVGRCISLLKCSCCSSSSCSLFLFVVIAYYTNTSTPPHGWIRGVKLAGFLLLHTIHLLELPVVGKLVLYLNRVWKCF